MPFHTHTDRIARLRRKKLALEALNEREQELAKEKAEIDRLQASIRKSKSIRTASIRKKAVKIVRIGARAGKGLVNLISRLEVRDGSASRKRRRRVRVRRRRR